MKWTCSGIKLHDRFLLVPFAGGGLIDERIDYDITIKKHNKKRSLNANAYAWVLIDEIAKALRTSKEEVYKKAIKACGVFEDLMIKNEAVKRFTETWEEKGLGWCIEYIKDNYGYTEIRAHYGSSAYNSEEMARLIDWLCDECNNMDIPTKKAEEIEELLKYWGQQ